MTIRSNIVVYLVLSITMLLVSCQVYTDEPTLWDADGDGWSRDDGDCDDESATVHPGAPEQCNGIDDDCDGQLGADEVDGDGDGFLACGECDDTADSVYPGATEQCNGVDDDCDGSPAADEVDDDGDTFLACEDCDDTDAGVNPSATEQCNDIDDDCDGVIDEDDAEDASTWYEDADGDTFGDPTSSTTGCDQPSGFVADDSDCDDTDADINPAMAEIQGDGINQDCDDWTDEIFVCQDGTGDYELISAAVAVAADGAVVEICPGTYEDTIEMPYVSLSIVGSTGNPEDVYIDSSGFDYTFFAIYELGDAQHYSEEWLFQGLSMTGGRYGAVVIYNTGEGGMTTFSNITIVDTYMTPELEPQSALFAVGSYYDTVLEYAYVHNNNTESSAYWGCGLQHVVVASDAGAVTIRHVSITENGWDAGANCWGNLLSAYGLTGHRVDNNIIANNHAWRAFAGGCPCFSEYYLVNNTIIGNELDESVVYYSDSPDYNDDSPPFGLMNNIICDNTADVSIEVGGDCATAQYEYCTPNVTYNWFCDYTWEHGVDATNYSGSLALSEADVPPYSLQPGSPAIDAGDPDAAYEDVDGTRNDLGVYGGPNGDWEPYAW